MRNKIKGFPAFQLNFQTRFPFSDILFFFNSGLGRQTKGMTQTDLENVPSGVSGCTFSPGAEEPRQEWAAIIYHLSCPLSWRSLEHLSHSPHLLFHVCAGGGARVYPFTHSRAIQWRRLQGHRTLRLVRVEKVTLNVALQRENSQRAHVWRYLDLSLNIINTRAAPFVSALASPALWPTTVVSNLVLLCCEVNHNLLWFPLCSFSIETMVWLWCVHWKKSFTCSSALK